MDNPTHTPREIQVRNIEHFLRTLFEPGDIIEIRGLGSPKYGTMRILTRDFNRAARAAVKMSAEGADTYFGLNPVAADSQYARAVKLDNLPRRASRTAKDADIACRNAYLLDFDPVRISGTAASPKQREAALALAMTVRKHLTGCGWPEPIVLDSGNGTHMIFRGDRCSPDGAHLELALKHLDRTMSTAAVKIDTVVHNPARISRIPGTLNKKANRLSGVISYPETFAPVAAGKIYGLAVEGGLKVGVTAARPKNGVSLDPDFNVENLIEAFPEVLTLDRVQTHGDVTFYALAQCPFAGREHTGQQVGAGKTCITLRPDGVGFHCFSDDCSDHTFVNLLKLLFEKTARRFKGPIWADNLEELAKRWGGIDILDDISNAAYDDTTTEAEEESEDDMIDIHIATISAIYRYAAQEGDRLVARANPTAQAAYRREVERILRAEDVQRMYNTLGKAITDEIGIDVLTSATPPVFTDPDGELTRVALDVLTHAHDLPRNLEAYTEAQFRAQTSQV